MLSRERIICCLYGTEILLFDSSLRILRLISSEPRPLPLPHTLSSPWILPPAYQAVSREVQARIAAALNAKAKSSIKERYAAHTASWRAAIKGAPASDGVARESPPPRPSAAARQQRDGSRSPLRGLSARDPLPRPSLPGPSKIPLRPRQQGDLQRAKQSTAATFGEDRGNDDSPEQQHPKEASLSSWGVPRVHVAFGSRAKPPVPSVKPPPGPKQPPQEPRKAALGLVPRVAGLTKGTASTRRRRHLGHGGVGSSLQSISEAEATASLSPTPSPPQLRPSSVRQASAKTHRDFLQQVARAAGLVPADLGLEGAAGSSPPRGSRPSLCLPTCCCHKAACDSLSCQTRSNLMFTTLFLPNSPSEASR
jgi:hypothetical protein